MTKNLFTRMLQASLMCCLAVLFTACDDMFASEDNPTPAYLSINTSDVTIKVDGEFTRKAIAVTGAVIEYSSNHPEFATVDQQGTVKGIAEGEATITAKATGYNTSGKKIYETAEVSYKVIVVANEPAPAVAAEATAEDVGKMIGADGKIYADAAAATAAGTTAVAMIAYVGSANCEAAPYNHGLALALSNANGGSTCQWRTSNTDAGHTKYTTTFYVESGLQYNATHNTNEYPAFKAAIANNGTAAPTGCSAWFLASGYQWSMMLSAAGGYSTLKTNAGLDPNRYWTCSEYDADYAWSFNFSSGLWGNYYRNSVRLVRSCLAF